MTVAVCATLEPKRLARPPPSTRGLRLTIRHPEFDAELVALLPELRAYARALSANAVTADDLVQEASFSALAHAQSYIPGTNMRAWIFTILRNSFYSQLRKRWREVDDPDGVLADGLSVNPEQDDAIDLNDTMKAMGKLQKGHRQALLLVAHGGYSYEEAASQSRCAVGTIKSRIHRGRMHLAELLEPRSSAKAR